MKTQVLDASVTFTYRELRRPLILSTGPITGITEASVEVRVRVNGRVETGCGSIYLSDLWAWPDPTRSHEERDAILREMCRRMAEDLPGLCGGEPEHPLELGMRLHHSVSHWEEFSTAPILARAMCASPFDAAIHDAVGLALRRPSMEIYDEPAPIPSADPYFPGSSAVEAISRMLLRPPRREFDAWLVVGKADSLEEEVAPWVRERGYRAFKLKIMGQDNAVDVARTVEVYRAVSSFGAHNPRLTIDSNEANPDAASVLDYLEQLRATDAGAFAALEYVEQPTGRDITVHRNDWREVTRLKPVLLDEGLTSLDLLEEARTQGWSGLALKTCKGHSFALVAAAWAHRHGMILTLQDLTNPGYSAIHAALFAAYVPTLNGVELNSPQYTPAANADWLPRLSGLLDPQDGLHRLPGAIPDGLGSRL